MTAQWAVVLGLLYRVRCGCMAGGGTGWADCVDLIALAINCPACWAVRLALWLQHGAVCIACGGVSTNAAGGEGSRVLISGGFAGIGAMWMLAMCTDSVPELLHSLWRLARFWQAGKARQSKARKQCRCRALALVLLVVSTTQADY